MIVPFSLSGAAQVLVARMSSQSCLGDFFLNYFDKWNISHYLDVAGALVFLAIGYLAIRWGYRQHVARAKDGLVLEWRINDFFLPIVVIVLAGGLLLTSLTSTVVGGLLDLFKDNPAAYRKGIEIFFGYPCADLTSFAAKLYAIFIASAIAVLIFLIVFVIKQAVKYFLKRNELVGEDLVLISKKLKYSILAIFIIIIMLFTAVPEMMVDGLITKLGGDFRSRFPIPVVSNNQ